MSEHRRRRPHSWAVFELTRLGERKAEEGSLPSLLRQLLNLRPDHPVFIPCKTYQSGHKRVAVHVMEGYAFVSADSGVLHLPVDQSYVKRIMTVRNPQGMSILSVVPDAVVLKMEADLASSVSEGVLVGSTVSVAEGVYKGMQGLVLDIKDDGSPVVRFQMRSLDTIVELDRDLVVPSDEQV